MTNVNRVNLLCVYDLSLMKAKLGVFARSIGTAQKRMSHEFR